MPLANREFHCLKCGFVCHRDLNASLNIDTAGQAEINACGLNVRPSLMKAVEVEAGTINKLE
jgi:transposase